MSISVSVSSQAISSGIGCCKTSIHALQSASKDLNRSYQQAGSNGWRDQKYFALGGIIEECCSALSKPIDELQDCVVKLNDLLQKVRDYENSNL